MQLDDVLSRQPDRASRLRRLAVAAVILLAGAGCTGDGFLRPATGLADPPLGNPSLVEIPRAEQSDGPVAAAPVDTASPPADLNGLVGQERDAVRRLFGEPQQVETDGVSLVWRYRASDCNLELVFYPDIKTEQYHALQYALTDGAGNEPAEPQPCLERIRQNGRRANS